MMRIDSVAAQPDRAGRHTVRFSNGTTMRLYRQTVEDFGLYAGLELTDEQFESMRSSAAAMSAKMRAVRIVAATNVSKSDLQHRLIQKGEDPEHAKNAVQWMSDMQLVDDRKTAEQIVSRCISKGYGIARAKQALYEKRIPKQYWQEVLEDYPDLSDAICAYLNERLGRNADAREVKRAVDALLRRGHSYSQIRRCLDQISLETYESLED